MAVKGRNTDQRNRQMVTGGVTALPVEPEPVYDAKWSRKAQRTQRSRYYVAVNTLLPKLTLEQRIDLARTAARQHHVDIRTELADVHDAIRIVRAKKPKHPDPRLNRRYVGRALQTLEAKAYGHARGDR
jgi:hypothetical protein